MGELFTCLIDYVVWYLGAARYESGSWLTSLVCVLGPLTELGSPTSRVKGTPTAQSYYSNLTKPHE